VFSNTTLLAVHSSKAKYFMPCRLLTLNILPEFMSPDFEPEFMWSDFDHSKHCPTSLFFVD
jgi:hypothetical protein